jgi:hypothetical protein
MSENTTNIALYMYICKSARTHRDLIPHTEDQALAALF